MKPPACFFTEPCKTVLFLCLHTPAQDALLPCIWLLIHQQCHARGPLWNHLGPAGELSRISPEIRYLWSHIVFHILRVHVCKQLDMRVLKLKICGWVCSGEEQFDVSEWAFVIHTSIKHCALAIACEEYKPLPATHLDKQSVSGPWDGAHSLNDEVRVGFLIEHG